MNPTQRHAVAQQRRQQIAAMYVQGKYQSEIAQQLGVTQQQVSYDLKVLQAAWLASAMQDFDAAKALELQRVDAVERESWAAWARSQQPREVTLTEATEGDKPSRKASVRKEGSAGDARFLDTVLKCVGQRCRILGLEAPITVNVNWDSLSDEQLARLAQGEPYAKVLAAPGMAEA